MSDSRNVESWRLLCARWQDAGHWFDGAVAPAHRLAFDHLVELKAVKPVATGSRYALCDCCGLHRAEVYRASESLELHCPDCGPVRVPPAQSKAWTIDPVWLIRKVRGALNVSAQHSTAEIADGVWQLGQHQRRAVILSRSLDDVLRRPSVFARASGSTTPWLITPKSHRPLEPEPLAGHAVWLPLEERFTLYGGNISFTEPGSRQWDIAEDLTQAVNGPFSADFRLVHLPAWPHGPIALSDAQSAVFRALWHFKGQPQTAETIMGRAGLGSEKPIDVFKVKKVNKGSPKYEGPHLAYQSLVNSSRTGEYVMPCAMLNPC